METNYIVQALEKLRWQSETQRLKKFQKNWEQYYGKGPKPMAVKSGKPDDNVRLNFARMIVDKGVSFLFGKEVKFELTEGEKTPAEQWLDDCWAANRKMTTLQKVALNGGVCGHSFVRLYTEPGKKFPRVIVLDPETVTISLAADDIDTVYSYKIQYPSIDPDTDKSVTVRQVIERDGPYWRIKDERGDIGAGSWQTISDSKWPYTFPPIVDCQNLPAPNEFWGISDIEDDLIEVMNANNFIMSNLVKIVRYHGHPKTWGTGFQPTQMNTAVDETIVLPLNATLQNLEMSGDMDKVLNIYKELKLFTHELSRVPEVATGKVESIGQLSGVALEILYQPLLEKTETKRMTYGDMLVEINRRLLALGGYGEELYTALRWQELLPKDSLMQANAALALKQLGVSGDTLMQEAGYDPDVEREKRKLEDTGLGEALLRSFDAGGELTE
mgnify:CR=1 FL=1